LLAEYTELHGTCVVPTRLEASSKFCNLHWWVYYQRDQIANYDDDPATSSLDEEQYQRLLIDLGLDKGPEKKSHVMKAHGTPWEEMLEELKQFKEENGHCVVPSMPKSLLRNWTQNMRNHYIKMKEGKQGSKLTPERVAQMLQLGFSFTVKKPRVSFDDRAIQWLEYRAKHGRDPPGDGHGVGQWVR
jgi:hypothetical protein